MLAAPSHGYRADIDGLRAVAVLPVLLFHAHVAGFSGGFVGVDIFFVISGYLITGIIAREIDARRFSLWDFYERRARRILPALFVVMMFVFLGASLLYLPGDFEGVPLSALAALAFLANVWFFSQAGYFQSSAEAMPLLHTWSLGVEEQFYIVFPLILLGAARFWPRLRVAMVWLGAFISLAIAIITQNAGDGFAFYLLPARAWELLAGALLALGAIPAPRSRLTREAIGWTGLALIPMAVLFYDRQTIFPGLAALPPVLGAVAIIVCAPGTSIGRCLSWRPAVWIGCISYSLYLWHWPLIVFIEYGQGARLAPWQSAFVVALSVMLAWASWRWIEQPFRNRQRFGRKAIFTGSIAGMAVLGLASAAFVSFGGWEARFPPESARMAAATKDVSPARDDCLRAFSEALPQCDLGAEVAPDAIVWGDSHAVEFAWELSRDARQDGRAIAQRTLASCPPVIGYTDPLAPTCAAFNLAVIEEIEQREEIETIYLAGFWANGRYGQRQAGPMLDATITRLRDSGREVVLIGAVPAQGFAVPRALARAAAYGIAPPPATSRSAYTASTRWLTAYFPIWRASGVQIIDPGKALVQDERTLLVKDGVPLYFDSHHLTLAGARLVLETSDRK